MTRLRALLLLLGIAAFLAAGATCPHLHASGEPGLWNEEHDLGLMAAHGSVAALADAAPVVAMVLVLAFALAPVVFRLPGGPFRLSDSRAPPAR